MPELPSLPPPNNAPQAGTSISATEVFTGQTITLDSSSSQDSDNDALETSVSWGDGSQSTWSSSSSFSHTYSVPGTYEISTESKRQLCFVQHCNKYGCCYKTTLSW